MSRLGSRIQEARKSHAMTEKQLAKKCGISEGLLKDIEIGRKIAPESLVDKISKVLNVNINEEVAIFAVAEEKKVKETTVEQMIAQNAPKETWAEAFGSLQKKIPVLEMDLKTVVAHKVLPIIDKKVEGFPPEQIMFIKMKDDDMRGYRLQRNDIVMVIQAKEIQNNTVMLLKYFGEVMVRKIQKLDAKRVLLLSSDMATPALTVEVKDLSVIGKCVKVEYTL